MRIELIRERLARAPRADVNLLGWRPPALAWATPGQVHACAPFDQFGFSEARLGHEVEHLTRSDFGTNDGHHPWWHFCGRVGHAVRLFGAVHLHPASLAAARDLQLYGACEVPA